MAHHKQHTLASVENPSKSLDPTTTNHRPQSTSPSTTTIYSLANHLSKLYTSDRSRSRSQNPNPQPLKKAVITHFQGKSLSKSSILDSSGGSFILDREKTVGIARESKRPAVLEKDMRKGTVGQEGENKRGDGFGGEVGLVVMRGKVRKEGRKGEESEDGQKAPGVLYAAAAGGRGGGGGVRVSAGMIRSRSLGSSQKVELGDFFVKNGVRVVSVDMPPFMQIHAVSCARKSCDSLEKFTSKALAFTLKKEFDGVYGPAWHCIVGKSFGSFVTHSVGGFLYFSIDQKFHILLFKTTVQVAD